MREDAQGFVFRQMSGGSEYLPVVISFVYGLLLFCLGDPRFLRRDWTITRNSSKKSLYKN